jgi:hypothetical protein
MADGPSLESEISLAASSLSMRTIKLGLQQIVQCWAIAPSTASKYLKRAETVGLQWPLGEGWDKAWVEATLFPRSEPPLSERQPARPSLTSRPFTSSFAPTAPRAVHRRFANSRRLGQLTHDQCVEPSEGFCCARR